MSVRMLRSGGTLPRRWMTRAFTRRALIGAGVAALATTALGSGSMLAGGMLTAAVSAAQQAADMLAARSPGLRTRAEMGKGKPPVLAERTATALPRVRRAPAAPPAVAVLPGPAGIGAPLIAPPPAAAAPAIFVPGAPTGGVVFGDAPVGFGLMPPPPGVGIGGGGGGLVITPPGETPGTPPPPAPPPPIPEPATWMTLILGFAAVGCVTRRRSRVAHA